MLEDEHEDFWLFDTGTPDRLGVAMNYAADGSLHGFDLVRDAETLDRYERTRRIVWGTAVPLNQFLAESRIVHEPPGRSS